ncbi:nucleotide sugar dehydrogenase [Candidatus Dependentiae bacterium]|nr:nucleotide sugar dehydrogenase [Candidatus Dependentiae bacterium]
MKKISVVGLGYIGLPTALITAKYHDTKNKRNVAGFDVDEDKIKKIMAGTCPIVEPGLQELLTEVLAQGNFRASRELAPADCFVIAVPTPFKENKQADLSYVWTAGRSIAKKITYQNLVILESTVPAGTTQTLKTLLEQESGLIAGKDFYIAYCPERVLPGKIILELVQNDRIIGGICDRSAELAQDFYKQFVQGTCYATGDKIAEMVKLVENSSRDIQIALANQIAGMCNQVSINPFEVIELANKHPRVNILQPGCGVGGHCIAVDPWFLIEQFPQNTQLLQAARSINDTKPDLVVQQVLEQAILFHKKHTHKPNVLVLGLTFKPDIDDLRESPALKIAKDLRDKDNMLNLCLYEPHIPAEKLGSLSRIEPDMIKALDQADIIVSLVKHSCFKTIDQKNIVDKIVVDPCGLFSKKIGPNYEATFLGKRESKTTSSSNPSG